MLTVGSVLITPRQFGPISGMPAARTLSQKLGLQRCALGSDFLETGRNYDHRLHALGNRLVDHIQTPPWKARSSTARSMALGMSANEA